jgi:hypothetical protein
MRHGHSIIHILIGMYNGLEYSLNISLNTGGAEIV